MTINTINIRLMGTLDECQEAIDKLDRNGITILETSRFYPNRGNTSLCPYQVIVFNEETCKRE